MCVVHKPAMHADLAGGVMRCRSGPQVNIRNRQVPYFNVTLNVSDSGAPLNFVRYVITTVKVVVRTTNHCPVYTGLSVIPAYENAPVGWVFGHLTYSEYDIPDVDTYV